MAHANRLKIEVKGICQPADLEEFSTYKNLIVMDIEGIEIDFLNKGVIDELKKSDWVIEIHYWEFLDKIKVKLKDKYDLEFIPTIGRTIDDFPMQLNPFSKFILKRYWTSLVQEWRTSNSHGWLVMKNLDQ
jgi:hypothetical protein